VGGVVGADAHAVQTQGKQFVVAVEGFRAADPEPFEESLRLARHDVGAAYNIHFVLQAQV
jgi:hypothetical protein